MLQLVIIDDDPLVRRALTALLGREYEVHTFAGAAEALTFLNEGARPIAIFVDASMPGMSGIQFQGELAKHEPIARIPLVLMTGDDSVQRSSLAGFRARLLKPFSAEEISVVLRQLCTQSESSRS